MNNDVLNINKKLTIIDEKEIGEIIQPLMPEIHLLDTFIAGTSYLKDLSPVDKAKTGDILILRREEKPFDNKAILVLNADGEKLGYILEKDNIVFSRLMDAGKLLKARIIGIKELEYIIKITVSINLIDF